MTEMELRNAFVHEVGEFYGCVEGDPEHLTLVNYYNQLNPLPRGYALKPHDAWCAATVSAIAQKMGITNVVFPECSVDKMVTLYKEAGRWQESDAYVPKPGDLIVYDWGDDGNGDNHGFADHVGVVVRITNGLIRTMEGNMGHTLGHRDIPLNGRYIRGFCCPDFASLAQDVSIPKFIDVDYEHDWYAEYIDYAAQNGLMSGTGNDMFEPKKVVSRAELAVVISNLHQKLSQ